MLSPRQVEAFLVVHVDDVKMAGAPAAMTAAWKNIESNHTMCDVPAACIEEDAMSTLLRDGSDDADSLAAKPDAAPPTKGTSTGKKQRGMIYEMHGFVEQCVELYLELTTLLSRSVSRCGAQPQRRAGSEFLLFPSEFAIVMQGPPSSAPASSPRVVPRSSRRGRRTASAQKFARILGF